MVSQIPWAHLKIGGGLLSSHKPEYRGRNISYQSLFDQTTEKDGASSWGSSKSAHHNLQKRTPVKWSFPIFSLLEEHEKRKRTKGLNLSFLFFFFFALPHFETFIKWYITGRQEPIFKFGCPQQLSLHKTWKASKPFLPALGIWSPVESFPNGQMQEYCFMGQILKSKLLTANSKAMKLYCKCWLGWEGAHVAMED